MLQVSVFDTKSYDRQFLTAAAGADNIDWRFHDFRLSHETATAAAGAQAVCVFVNDQVDRACVEMLHAHGVRLIALRCAGYNNVDLEAAHELGLAIVRVPAYSPHAVAEHTVALLLSLNRKIPRAFNRVRDLNFSLSGLVGFDLFEKTVGIIGTGSIGRIAAQIFRGFGCKVIANDPFPSNEWAATHGVEYADLNTLLAASDIVSLHAPLVPDTLHLLDGDTLALMKPGAYIVNTSRGKLIDTRALIGRLKAGLIGGVALDVYEEEQGVFFEDLSNQMLADDELARLLTFPNVLITAHQAFLTKEALNEIARITVANLRTLATDEPCLAGTTL